MRLVGEKGTIETSVGGSAAVTMGLLEAAGLQSRVTPWIIFGAGMFGWGIASIVAGRR